MLYREIIAVYSQIHTKHINTPFGQNVELLNVKLAVHIVNVGTSTANETWRNTVPTVCSVLKLTAWKCSSFRYSGAPEIPTESNET